MINRPLRQILILLCLAYVFLMLGNGILSLTNPDEVFYSQTAREMMQQHTWMTPYIFGVPQFEKPVLAYWLLRIGFGMFGVVPFVARLFPALFAILGVIAVYCLGRLGFKDEKRAFISGLVLMSSALYIGLARTVFTDMIFSIFILLSLLSFYWGYCRPKRKGAGILLFFIFAALAVLTKGPLGILIPFSVILVFLWIKKDLRFLFCGSSFLGILLFVAISIPWYALMVKKYGSTFIQEFFYNDHVRRLLEAEHIENDTWYFYPVSIVMGTLPWALYTAAALIYLFKNLRRNSQQFYLFLASWITVTFLIFQPAHSKLASYVFPVLPAVALVIGDFIYNAIYSNIKSRLFRILSYITVSAIALVPITLIVAMNIYSTYISSRILVYALAVILLLLSVVLYRSILQRKLFRFIFLLSFLLPITLFGALSMHKDIELYTSSKPACEYLLKNYNVSGVILCSKPYVRGVRYYTDKDTAVLDTPGKNFFSPHPIPFLNNDESAIAFLKKQPVTYCVLKKSAMEDIQRIAGKEFKASLLKAMGNVYLFKVEPNH